MKKNFWIIGTAAKKVMGTAIAMALCGSASCAVLTVFPDVGKVIAPNNVLAKLATSEETNDMVKRFSESIESAPSRKVGELISARLSAFSSLPNARISVVRGKESPDSGVTMRGSFTEAGSPMCSVVLVVDAENKATLVRDMPRSLGFIPSHELSDRLTDFEMLHELGHCKAQQNNDGFNHPALSKEQNNLLSSAIKGTEVGDIWEESYADMFAALNQMEAGKSSHEKSATARADMEIVVAWRKMGRLKNAKENSESIENKLEIESGVHVTEVAFQALLNEPHWIKSKESIETRAAQLASIGLVRTLAVTANPEEEAEKFTSSRKKMEKALKAAFSLIRQDVADSKDLQESRPYFIIREAVSVSNVFNQGGEVLKALGLRSKELSAVAWDVETKELNERQSVKQGASVSIPEIEANFAIKFSRQLDNWKLLDEIASDPKMRQDEIKTIKAWDIVSKYEAGNSYKVDDPRPEALMKTALAEKKGEGNVLKEFYSNVVAPVPLKSRLNEWRASRQVVPNSSSKSLAARPV